MDLAAIVDKLKAFWAMQGKPDSPVPEPPPAAPPEPSAAPDPNLPRGIRNNSPGNLRPGPQPWIGQTGVDGGYCVFDTPEHGIRALAKLLVIYQDRYSCATITAIIARWAPPSDHNDTGAYVSAVCADTGFGADDWLHLHEPSVLGAVTKAIIHHENGQQPYSDALIAAAVADALA